MRTYTSSNVFTSITVSGASAFGAGAVNAPSLYLSTDTTTGWYRRSTNLWTFTDQGTGIVELGGSQIKMLSTGGIGWASGAITTATDTGLERAGANSIKFGGTIGAGLATTRTEINKAVTAFSNTVAKTVFTIAIPNAAHSASIEIQVTGSLGAGGAIGANEATATNKYVVSVTRTAGVNATAAISSAYGAAATAVAGAATVTATAALAAVSGAVGAANTIDIQVTISRSGGSSDNHTCVAHAMLLNANATGITIS